MKRNRKLDWFKGHDGAVPFEDRMRAGSFGMLAQPLVLDENDDPPMPATTYEPDPAKWRDLVWYDRRNGESIEVTWAAPGDDPEEFAQAVRRGAVPIRTLGQVLTTYVEQPEHKSLSPDGVPASATSTGELRRRPVESALVLTDLIGKEGSNLAERAAGETFGREAYGVSYGQREDRWQTLLVPVLRSMGVEKVMHCTNRSRSSVFEAIAGRSRSKVYLDVSVNFARNATGWKLPADPWAVLHCYLRQSPARDRSCAWCGGPIEGAARRDAKYCSAACRQAARRARSS